MLEIQNFIHGEFSPSQSKEKFDVINPATGEVMARAAKSDGLDVVLAVQAANKAFQDWSQTTAQERAAVLNRIADGIEKRADQLALLESQNVGKPLKLARGTDIERAILNFRIFAAEILTEKNDSVITSQKLKTDEKAQNYLNYVLRQPVGVAGLIVPWNYPLSTLTWKLAPCLAMGNVVVCKPSELTPVTASVLAEILNEAGLPKGVVNIVNGFGPDVGAPLAQHPGVRLISFTGSTETGGMLQKITAGQYKRLSLEMGGKNANIIFKDANLKEALQGTLRSSFLNSGQVCLAGSRLLIQEDIYKEFLTEFVKLAKEVKVGNPLSDDTFMGPLGSRAQLEKVEAAVEQAKKENGRILCGGSRPDLPAEFKNGFFYSPTVIEDLTMCSDLWQKEIFGPVVTVQSFKYQHEAVKWANTSSYGLSASLWTENLSQAHKVAAQIQAGTVWVNSWAQRDPRVPFGGVKTSGLGREGAEYSMNFYSDIKNVCVKI